MESTIDVPGRGWKRLHNCDQELAWLNIKKLVADFTCMTSPLSWASISNPYAVITVDEALAKTSIGNWKDLALEGILSHDGQRGRWLLEHLLSHLAPWHLPYLSETNITLGPSSTLYHTIATTVAMAALPHCSCESSHPKSCSIERCPVPDQNLIIHVARRARNAADYVRITASPRSDRFFEFECFQRVLVYWIGWLGLSQHSVRPLCKWPWFDGSGPPLAWRQLCKQALLSSCQHLVFFLRCVLIWNHFFSARPTCLIFHPCAELYLVTMAPTTEWILRNLKSFSDVGLSITDFPWRIL